MNYRITDPKVFDDDREFDRSLRPTVLKEFIGQERIATNLEVFVKAALKRGEALDHVLLCGPPGLGKTTLSHIIGNELGVKIKATSGPVIVRPADLAGILTNLKKGDVLFIDEIHRLNRTIEEYLYGAMEDFIIDIVIDKGPAARSIKLNLEPFTLVGATTRLGLITAPLRSRFGVIERLGFYGVEELMKIVMRSARILGIPIDEPGCREIACRSRGTPRVTNRLLRRIRDFAEIKADGRIDTDVAKMALKMLEVDSCGLDEMDIQILNCIVNTFTGGPVGLTTIASALNEEEDTIAEVYEPFLLQEGFIERTPRGRRATRKTFEHLGAKPPSTNREQFLLGDDSSFQTP